MGRGVGRGVGVVSMHPGSGRDRVETTGVGGTSPMVTSFVESSTLGSGLKTSYGEIVCPTLGDNGKAGRKGL
jgi:hypothetical protein